MSFRIACIIPTYNAERYIKELVASLLNQDAFFDIYFVDSNSIDKTRELIMDYGLALHVIPSEQFNHGGTRQLMVDINKDYDIYVFLTQDVSLIDQGAISNLVDPFKDNNVGAVCGRQLPHLDATPLAQHARYYNYPEEVVVKGLSDIPRYGIKTAFMSNSFAAYRGRALLSVGGFPNNVIFAEDMYVAARMILDGWKVVYSGNATCRHSHNYTILEEFNRYFDMGVFHSREPWIRASFGGAGSEGLKFVKSEISFLGLKLWHFWFEALFRTAIKLLGYKLGQHEAKLPISLKRKIGMYKRYWNSPFA